LEAKSVCAEEDISALKTDNEMSKMNINLMNRNMNNISSKLDQLIKDLKDAGVLDGNFKGGNNTTSVDEDRFGDLMAKVMKLQDRVDNLEGCMNANTNSIEKIIEKLNDA
jgi:chaperonin cofactor prefoldin